MRHKGHRGFGRMLRWAEGWLGQEAGMQLWGRGSGEGGTQEPADHTSLLLLPGLAGAWARGSAQPLAPAGLSPATSSHLTHVCAPSPAPCQGQRNIRGSEFRRSSGAQPGHNLFISSFLPFYLFIYSFIQSLWEVATKTGTNSSYPCIQSLCDALLPLRSEVYSKLRI